MFLTEELEDTLEYADEILHVDMAFDTILKLFELFKDNNPSDYQKIDWGLEALLFDYEKIEEIDIESKYELFKYIMKEFLNIDLEAQQEKQQDLSEGEASKEKAYDFAVDSERIYASFFMDYGMDLIEQQGKLHWKKFLALLEGLSKETSFMQVVDVRTMEVPKPTKHNAEHRNKIIRLQDKYSLLTKEEKIAAMDEQFDSLASAFVGKAGD